MFKFLKLTAACKTDGCNGKDCRIFTCLDCSTNTLHTNEYYMVHQGVWTAAHPKKNGMLCIGCLEARLGRKLTAADFTDAPLNWSIYGKSKRLANRLLSK